MLKHLLKTPAFFLLLNCFALAAYAQKPLTPSRQSSYYTYIYKLQPADVWRFYKYPDKDPDDNILHNPVDSFKTGKYWDSDDLPAGNYLKVYAEKNALHYDLIEKHSVFLKLIENQYDLRFSFVDTHGKEARNVQVTINNRAIPFDNKIGLFQTRYAKRDTIIRADFAGVANYFSVKKENRHQTYQDESWFTTRWLSVKKLFIKDKYNRGRKYDGFIVFNKPKYRPRDTVKFKALAFNGHSRKPVTDLKAMVVLRRAYGRDKKILGSIESYNKGGFAYSFVLDDSLKLQLDEDYEIMLVKPGDSKDILSDDYNIGPDSKTLLVTGRFNYEDYELKSTLFKMRTDKKENSPGNPMSVYLSATDENDLPVADGRVTLTLTKYTIYNYKADQVFIPDTLWTHKMTLEQVGETKLELPDSIFPKANFRYQIRADFLNSNNEHRQQFEYVTYNYNTYNVVATLNDDTLVATYMRNGKEIKGPAIITELTASDDTISKIKVMLPSKTLINPNVATYNIDADSTDTDLELKKEESGVSVSGYRTSDSLFVSVSNNRHIHFWYSLFSGNKLIDAGEGTNLVYRRAYRHQNNATFLVNYVWGGEDRTAAATIKYEDKLLNINVRQPVTVYPGQQVTSVILVTDANGKPVPNIDLTAWSFTRKFPDYNPPFVPYLGKSFPYRKKKELLALEAPLDESGSMKLNWQRWSREMGLDSISYYQFTHPKTIYRIEETTPDTITQIAPFIVKNGDIVPVHILYIDEKPVYFSHAGQLQRYSFRVVPGRHLLRFRTAHMIIKLDSVWVERSKKLILGINADKANAVKASDTLSHYETNLLNEYMIAVANNFGVKMALLQQGNNLTLINDPNVNGNTILTGPLSDDYATLITPGEKPRTFLAESGYSFEFEPGLLKQKSLPSSYPLVLSTANGTDDYTQCTLTRTAADTIWQQYLDLRNSSQQLFMNPTIDRSKAGELTIERKVSEEYPIPFIKNVIIYRYDDPDFMRIYPGNTIDFDQLPKGKYRALYLLRGDKYDIKENIVVKPYGMNFYQFYITPAHQRDSVSIKISNIINSRLSAYQSGDGNIENDALKIKEVFNERYFEKSVLKGVVSGTVIAKDDGLPIPGCTVKIKGTTIVTYTNAAGKFTVPVPKYGSLIFSSVGYTRQEIAVQSGDVIKVALLPSASELGEVVVTTSLGVRHQSSELGYSSVTAYAQGLSGKVAGLGIYTLEAAPGGADKIIIRGLTSTGAAPALIVVDGEIVSTMNGIDPNSIGDISVLKDAAATALYGSQAANGVIIITTKKKAGANPQTDNTVLGAGEQSLRKNFSDYAYWQPRLITDAEGKASFTTTFPDDITNWRTFVVAVNGQNKQTGFKEGQVKSFRPLSANFVSPAFAVRGDQVNVIGKVMNYTSDTVKLTRTFSYNDKMMLQGSIKVKNAVIDTMHITADGADSLTFEYTIKRDNGYFDGERRKVPVIEQGTQETKGSFTAMDKDTTVTMKFDPALGPVTFRAEASVLPILLDEAERLRNYQYLCNEQLASKLKGLLAEKRVKTFLKQPFKWDKNIRQIIIKLQENRRATGTWGWWKDTEEELWISLHAIEALIDAGQQGFNTDLEKPKLTEYLVHQLESYNERDKLYCLELLKKLDAKVDYAKYANAVDKQFAKQRDTSKYSRFRLMLVRQQVGLPIAIDSVLKLQHHTLFGNIYWGEYTYRFFDNSIQLSVLAYKLIKNEGKHPELLAKIRGYFLEQRRDAQWRNTYESSLILETILPDLLTEGKEIKPTVITLSGAKNETVTVFPYTANINANEALSIAKTGTLPVYITGYQQFWNRAPEKVSKDFTVNTWFESKGEKITKLKGGEAVRLQVQVIAKGDADYVMINVPIPAGCSYESKEQPWQNEVHREYFKDRVSIFSRKLKQGTYTFTVNLMPRYDGVYNINPARAEMMYFPVFYGREGMKKVVVGD